jgi:hypothetical protein
MRPASRETGTSNSRNSHIWDDEHPHAMFVRVHQQRFSVNIWAGIVGGHLLGPVILPSNMHGAAYLEVLQNMLPLLMVNVPLAMHRNMWFLHDFSLVVRSYLNTYGKQ